MAEIIVVDNKLVRGVDNGRHVNFIIIDDPVDPEKCCKGKNMIFYELA